MIKHFLISYLLLMVTMTIVGVVFVAITGGTPGDLLPILLGASIVGVPISAWGAWKNRNR